MWTSHAFVNPSAEDVGHLGVIAPFLGESLNPILWLSGSPCFSGSLTLPLTATLSPPQAMFSYILYLESLFMFNSFPPLESSPSSLSEFIGFCSTRVSLSICFSPFSCQSLPSSVLASSLGFHTPSMLLTLHPLPTAPFFPITIYQHSSHSEFRTHSLVCPWRHALSSSFKAAQP